MIYSSKIFALLAVFALAFSGLGFSPAMSFSDDAAAVTKVALTTSQEEGEGQEDSTKKGMMKGKRGEMSGEMSDEMKAKMKKRHKKMHDQLHQEMEEMDKEDEKDDD